MFFYLITKHKDENPCNVKQNEKLAMTRMI